MNLGDKIKDRYRVDAKLGEGGMGQVYRCYDQQLNREVAIKLLLEDVTAQVVLRFHAEAKALAQLDHPNVSSVWDFGQDEEGQLFLVMEYIKGESLTRFIKKKGGLSFADAKPIFEKICLGLRHAHFHKILHRDIKPGNVMLASGRPEEESVKLVDFGLAKQTDRNQSLTSTGAALGSPPYIAPEAVQGREIDVRSDIYSLGCLFFELLAGKPPFMEQTPVHTMMAHMNKMPPTLAERSGRVFDEEVEDFVQLFLMKNPEERFQNVDEILEELEIVSASLLERQEAQERSVWAAAAAAVINARKAIEARIDRKWIVASMFVVILGTPLAVYVFKNLFPKENMGTEVTGTSSQGAVNDTISRHLDEGTWQKKVQHPVGVVRSRFDVELNPRVGVRVPAKICSLFGKLSDEKLLEEAPKNKDSKSVRLEDVQASDEGLRPFLSIPAWTFYFKFTPVTEKMFRYLGSNQDMYLLNITDCGEVSAAGLKYLQSGRLRALEIQPGKVRAGQIQAISGLRMLNILSINQFEMHKDDLKDLTKMPGLYALHMKDCKTTGILNALGKWKRCINLHVTECDLTEDDLKSIGKLSNLMELHLHDTNMNDERLLELRG
ncbi:MAG: serine/threonine protein kinase, partial [Cyanobacteria bacterium]|nr:serine/threonine protein kinase [Cyanobacteriota bacterium]